MFHQLFIAAVQARAVFGHGDPLAGLFKHGPEVQESLKILDILLNARPHLFGTLGQLFLKAGHLLLYGLHDRVYFLRLFDKRLDNIVGIVKINGVAVMVSHGLGKVRKFFLQIFFVLVRVIIAVLVVQVFR